MAQPVSTGRTVKRYRLSDYGLKPDSKKNASPIMQKIITRIQSECGREDSIIIQLEKGRYDFHEKGASLREYYISNHDQEQPKRVGIALESLQHLTLEGNGAQLVFHGRMLPVALLHTSHCTLKDFSIDFETPHITQVRIIQTDEQHGVVFQPEPWVNCRITSDSVFESYGEGWQIRPEWGMAFEETSRRIVYNSGDLPCPTKGIKAIDRQTYHAPLWKDKRLKPGQRFAMRGWGRPAPGVFLSHNVNTSLLNVQVHYAEGMGLLAQLCEDILLDGFCVCLKGDDDPRYFTTQADATHFSGCKGRIISRNGLYEGMMDDAINVHGTYLKVVGRIDDHTLVGRYMHGQTWGFDWGMAGDEVQFIRSSTMEICGQTNRISSIRPHDKEQVAGCKEFLISFTSPVDKAVCENEGFGIENLTWTPEVVFSGNTIRNNRARGALFSTPRKTIVENNLFDHTSGTAILLCGDCNGWYETGACREVVIRHNRFINALTSLYQFTQAVISIYPEIPQLEKQQQFFHGGKEHSILIEDNLFDSFDTPLLYAKSVDGLTFRNNVIKKNEEYRPFHSNNRRFRLEKVNRVNITE